MKTNFDAYLRYGELTRALHALAEEQPGFCKVESIGKSNEGREIWLAELTNAETGPPETKPAFWVDGNTDILQMRVEDENGEWRASDKDGRLMVPRTPDEADPEATYYRLYREG